MRKFLIILFFCPIFLFAQKVKNQNSNQSGDLKDFAGKYCTVVIVRANPLVKQVQTDSDTWDFIDTITSEKLKPKNVTAVINHMDKNAWQFTTCYVDETFQFIIFKKRE